MTGDSLYLALAAAAKETGATPEEIEAFKAAIRRERMHSPWPPGFMSEF